MTETNGERRIITAKTLLKKIGQGTNEQKQKYAIFSNRFLMGMPFDFLPLSGASEYERIAIDRDFHVVVLRNAETHLLLTVGTLQEVEAWAKEFKYERNPHTGRLQFYRVTATPTVTAPKTGFPEIPDEELLSIGVPRDLLPLVRSVTTEKELEAIQQNLPEHVYEALTWAIQGERWESIKEAYLEAERDDKAVFATDLGRLDAGNFHVITSDEELRSIMDKPLAQWRVFLHPLQQKIVDNAWHGAVLVTGGAGTGKTVVALHRARHLVRLPDWKDDEKLLFTTFTKNLALDLEQLLRQICTRDEMKRIQVQNIDAWLATYIRQHGADKRIVYPGEKGGVYETCWEYAWAGFTQPEGLDRPESFYRSEFEEVVLPQHCMTSRDYMFADRKGRGRLLSRMQRKAIWPLFEDMRLELQLKDAMTVEDATHFACEEIKKQHPNGLYRAVIADEIQDFKPDMLKLLRALATDVRELEKPIEGDLFLTGDAHQRIYTKPVSFTSCGIEVRGRSRKLRLNYRTTDEIRKVADAVYTDTPIDDMDGGTAETTGYAALKHGSFPKAHLAQTFEEEVDWILAQVKVLKAEGYALQDACVVVRTNEMADRYAQTLAAKGLAIQRISRGRSDDAEAEGIRIATMHRVKGLEFKVVFIAGMNEGSFPLPAHTDDPVAEKAHLQQEKALFYVAASRASNLLFMSAYGETSDLFNQFFKSLVS